MIYIIHGDKIDLKDKALTEIKGLYGDSIFAINSDTLNGGDTLLSYIHSIDLWGVKQIIMIDNILDDIDFKDILYENLEEIKNSDNVFVLYERDINAASLTKIKKFATKVYNATMMESNPNTTPFTLCDYVAARDKRRAWPELLHLYDVDIDPESIHGALWWKMKTLMLPSNFNKYKKEEAERLSYNLLMISARAHSGECDFKLELERWVLSI